VDSVSLIRERALAELIKRTAKEIEAHERATDYVLDRDSADPETDKAVLGDLYNEYVDDEDFDPE
jgi:hypothetical protein